jgi:hypothetical protein
VLPGGGGMKDFGLKSILPKKLKGYFYIMTGSMPKKLCKAVCERCILRSK